MTFEERVEAEVERRLLAGESEAQIEADAEKIRAAAGGGPPPESVRRPAGEPPASIARRGPADGPAEALAQRRQAAPVAPEEPGIVDRALGGLDRFLDRTGIGAFNENLLPGWRNISGQDRYSANSPRAAGIGQNVLPALLTAGTGGLAAGPVAAGEALPAVAARTLPAGMRMAPTAENAIARSIAKVAPDFARTAPAQARLAATLPVAAAGNTLTTVANEGRIPDPEEVALGLSIPAALHVASAPARGVGNSIRDTRKMSGKYVRALERSAPYRATDEYKQLDEGLPGVGVEATRQGKVLGNLQASRLDDANATYGQARKALPDMDVVQDMSNVHRDLKAAVKRAPGGEPQVPEVETEVERLRTLLSVTDPNGELIKASSPEALLEARQNARRMTQPGMPDSKENVPYRETYAALQKGTHELPAGVGDAIKNMDDVYSKEMELIAEGNELIFGRDNARAVTDSLAMRKKAAELLRRSVMDTQAGGSALTQLEDIRALGPRYADAVDKVAGKIADEATKFGAPRVFGHSGKWPMQLLTQNVGAANVKLVAPFTRKADAAARNWSLRAGLALHNPAEAMAERRRRQKEGGRE